MDPATEARLKAAETRGREMLDTQPRASAVRYDRRTGRVVIDLTNGCAYAFPAGLAQDLQGASDEDLARIELDGLGFTCIGRPSMSTCSSRRSSRASSGPAIG